MIALILGAACGRKESASGESNGNATLAQNVNRALDPTQFDAEISRLEQEAVANPGDDDVRLALAQAYLARANARRASGQLEAALKDYSTALRYDPDNVEAQREAVAVMDQLQRGREAAGENNEPEPLPISPDVMTEEDRATPTPQGSPGKRERR